MERLLFATNNPGKLQQVRDIAQDQAVEVLGLADLDLQLSVPESGSSFAENALLKLQSALLHVEDENLWVTGDDSGVTIDALGGEPGIHTKNWAGYSMSDEEIISYTFERLRGIPYMDRTAQGISVVALGKLGSRPLFFEGVVEGIIIEEPASGTVISSQQGFPFRDIFYLPDLGKSLGEMEQDSNGSANHWQRSFKKVIDHILLSTSH